MNILYINSINLDLKLPISLLQSESELVITSSWFTRKAFVFLSVFYIIQKKKTKSLKNFVCMEILLRIIETKFK